MQELIDKLQKDNGLNAAAAKEVLKTITDFVKEKFPMIGGAVDNLFQVNDEEKNPSSEQDKNEK